MPREKEDFRANLELIREMYQNKTMLNVSEITRLWGRDRASVERVVKPYVLKGVGVSVITLARLMS